MKKFKSIVAAGVMVLAGLAVAGQPVEAAPAVASLEPVYVAPARLPWGDVATNASSTAVKSSAKTGGVQSLKGMPKQAGNTTSKLTGTATYFYATADQVPPVTTTGVYAQGSSVPNPTVYGAAGSHSLGEIAVFKDTAANRQIVEIGWTKDANVCGANSPCLFGYWWKNNKGQGYNGFGFVPGSGATIALGASLLGTPAKRFGIEHTGTGSGGCWWLAYDTTWVGCYPDALWSSTANGIPPSNSPAVTFTSTGYYQMFGEVADATSGSVPASTECTDMGNGVLGTATTAPLSSSWGSGALVTSGGTVNANMSIGTAAYPTYWNSAITAAGRTHRYGGPGAC
jgi:hypothetical protein